MILTRLAGSLHTLEMLMSEYRGRERSRPTLTFRRDDVDGAPYQVVGPEDRLYNVNVD